MSTRFLLPCSCGESIPVSRSQSGLEVTCPQCQQQQRIPRLADLQSLPQVREEPAEEHSWGASQLVVFIGITICLFGAAMALWKWLSLGPSPMAEMERLYGPLPEDLPPAETLMLWEQINREGLDTRFPVPAGVSRFESLYGNWLAHHNWIWIWLGVALVGLLIAGIGLWEAPRRSRRPRAAPKSPSSGQPARNAGSG